MHLGIDCEVEDILSKKAPFLHGFGLTGMSGRTGIQGGKTKRMEVSTSHSRPVKFDLSSWTHSQACSKGKHTRRVMANTQRHPHMCVEVCSPQHRSTGLSSYLLTTVSSADDSLRSLNKLS